MKNLTFLALILAASVARAENTSLKVNDIGTESDQETTITIRKGATKKPEQVKEREADHERLPDFESTVHDDDVQGKPSLGKSKAMESWKSACSDWKIQIKKDAKEEDPSAKVLAAKCGTPSCAMESGRTTCTSTSTYTLKVRVRGEEPVAKPVNAEPKSEPSPTPAAS